MSRGLAGCGVGALLALGVCGSAHAGSGASLIAQIAKQLDQHPLVMIGELHRYAELHAFLREMLRDPAFICRVDDIVVEFGNARLQEVADAYASGGKVSETRLQSLWRETVVPLTWNSPVYRQFYETVRDLNQKRLCDHPIRIVLGDPQLEWASIRTAKDYLPFADRDGHFADVVEREVLAKHHRAFLLAGVAHAMKRMPEGAQAGQGEVAAAELIERKHPGSLFCIVTVPSAEAAEAMQMGTPPAFRVVRGSELEHADFGLIRKLENGQKWPSIADVVDGLLYLGPEKTFSYPPAAIYLDPGYQQELRRHAAIIKDYSGQDFLTAIDELVREGSKDLEGLFRSADAKGAALAIDVPTGSVVASVGAGRDVGAAVLPLSVIKLYLAAVWWDRGLDGSLDDMLVDGLDQPAKDRAVALRKRFGGVAVLDDLRREGLDSLELPPDADDATWGATLSIGEQHVTVTLPQVSQFLRSVALARSDTARRLQAAMRACVSRGTARGVAAKQAGARWRLGGKTGTGPAGKKPYDGWFAGLVFMDGEPRYTVAVHVDDKGSGGGVASTIAAELARVLSQRLKSGAR